MTFSNRWNRVVYALWAPVYDLLIRFHPVARLRARALAAVNIRQAESILLIGAGTGADLPFLNPSSLIVAADISPPMLRRCRVKAQELHVPIIAVCCDAGVLPCADHTFDMVVLTLIVSVVPDPRDCLQEVLRVLRPGGKLLVLDKFLPAGQQPSWFRRCLNLVTRPFGTDINRRWEDLSAGLGTTLVDEATGLAGSLRIIVVQKPGDE